MNVKCSVLGASHKQEVYFASFSDPSGHEKEIVEDAVASFTKTYALTWNEGGRDAACRLSRTPESIIQAMNDGSCKYIFRVKPGDRFDMMSDFKSSVLLDIRAGVSRARAMRSMLALIEAKNEVYAPYRHGKVNIKYARRSCDRMIDVGFVDESKGTVTWCNVPETMALKTLLRAYSAEVGEQLSSIWFESDTSDPLFLSNLGDDKLTDWYIMSGSFIHIKRRQLQSRSPLKALANSNLQSRQSRPKTKSKGKQKTKKKGKKQPVARTTSREVQMDELRRKDLRDWMDALSICFGEAEPLFKKRRERLDAIGLQRDAPKARVPVATNATNATMNSELSTNCVGGKAGTTCFFVRVGDEANLYKTAKPSKANRCAATRDFITVDLHGLNAKEALSALDKQLPQWIDAAMKGSHPWLISVKIICGGGSQVLAETVGGWIRRTRQVCRAPKSDYC